VHRNLIIKRHIIGFQIAGNFVFKLSERFGWGVKKEAFIRKIEAGNCTTSEQTYSVSLSKVSRQIFTKNSINYGR